MSRRKYRSKILKQQYHWIIERGEDEKYKSYLFYDFIYYKILPMNVLHIDGILIDLSKICGSNTFKFTMPIVMITTFIYGNVCRRKFFLI